ncbi:MAG: RNA polymerase sigma factor [Nitrospirota bacterium]
MGSSSIQKTGLAVTQREWAERFQPHAHDIRQFLLRRLKCPETASDVLQDTFLRLMQSAPAVAIENPRAWLFRIAANLATDHLRRRQHRGDHLSDEEIRDDIPDARPSAETQIFTKQQVEILKQAIAELPPKCREVFILHKFKHLSYAEVSVRLGIARSTVVKHMIKALAHCKRRIDEAST